MRLADYVFKFVEGLGVKHVFMLAGGGAMHLVDSLGKSKLKYICNLHEQACAIATTAYSQYNGFGVCLVTTGVGVNAVTGVASAWLDSIPCLFISGQVKRSDIKKDTRQFGFQEIGIVDIVKSITKYAVTIIEPESIKYHLEKAIHLAKSGRAAPVWLDIPLDVQASDIDETQLKGFHDTHVSYIIQRSILESDVAKTTELLNKSKRPIILAGNGARQAFDELSLLVQLLKIPILTTWRAIDFMEDDNPLFCGRPGGIGQRGANFVLQNADLLISIGARLDLGQTGYSHENFAPNAKKVIVDIDSAEIRKLNMQVDIPICADAEDFVREMRRQRYDVSFKDKNGWLKLCKEWSEKYSTVLKDYWNEKGYVNNYVFVEVLSDAMCQNDLLIPASAGQASEITMQAFKVKHGQRIFNTPALGAMGFGIASAIGGCLASGRRIVCIEGDGGFAMMTQELATIKHLKLPIKFFVLNNKGYVSIRNMQRNNFGGHLVGCDKSSGLSLPDIAKIANAYGIYYARIENHDNMKEKIKSVLDNPNAVVCEVMINPDQQTEPRIVTKIEDGRISSGLLEDMYPYLSREEFEGNMICQARS